MSDVRKSVPAKVIASLLILVSVFSLCWQGMAVLRGIDYVLTDSWQDTWEFKELIREREDQLAEWFAARAALEDPGLAYLDQVRYETDAERIGAAMAQDQTSFRYRVLSQDGTKVLATNLAPGESLEQPGARDPLCCVPSRGAPDPALEQQPRCGGPCAGDGGGGGERRCLLYHRVWRPPGAVRGRG